MKNLRLKISNFSILILVLGCLFFTGYVLADTFTDDSQSEFDAGTYSNTLWSTNHVQLGVGQTSGLFTSQVFDGGSVGTVSWTQINWSETLTSVDKLLMVDSNADAFKSLDDGVSWTKVNDDYNEADTNNMTDMVRDGNYNIFILFNQDIWKSTDAGVTWTRVNDDYNGGEGENGQLIAVDSSNNLYVVEGDKDVWQSSDSGVNWTKMGNTGSANAAGFVGAGATLFLVDVNADVWRSTDSGVNWTKINDDYNGADTNNASYMVPDSSGNLVILFNQDVWRSTDSGVNWTKVSDDYNGAESQNGILLARNSSNELFIVEGDDDVWQSTNNGTSWTKLGNFGGGTVRGLVSVSVSTNIMFSTRSGSTNPPTDDFSGSLTDPSGGNPGVLSGRYFQYQASFSTEDSSITPELLSVTITDTLGDPAPSSTPTLTPLSGGIKSGNITVTKKVINNNGGTKTSEDFQLFVGDVQVTSGVTNVFPAPANVYTVTEQGDAGYSQAFSGDCDVRGQLNLNAGDNKLCILTNDDIPAPATSMPMESSSVDYNNDKKIDISDWSIFVSNWSSSEPDARARDDLNKDGKLDVLDLSIFLVSFQLGSPI